MSDRPLSSGVGEAGRGAGSVIPDGGPPSSLTSLPRPSNAMEYMSLMRGERGTSPPQPVPSPTDMSAEQGVHAINARGGKAPYYNVPTSPKMIYPKDQPFTIQKHLEGPLHPHNNLLGKMPLQQQTLNAPHITSFSSAPTSATQLYANNLSMMNSGVSPPPNWMPPTSTANTSPSSNFAHARNYLAATNPGGAFDMEVVHMHVIRKKDVAANAQNDQYDIVIGPPNSSSDIIATYPNQILFFRTNTGDTASEREAALNNLKHTVWTNFMTNMSMQRGYTVPAVNSRQGTYTAAKPMHSIAPKPDHRATATPPLQPAILPPAVPTSVSVPPAASDKSESALMSWKRATERYQNALKEYAERSRDRAVETYDSVDTPPHVQAGLALGQRAAGGPELYTHNITMKPERKKKAKFADTVVTQTVSNDFPPQQHAIPAAKRKARQVDETPAPIVKTEQPAMTYLDALAANGQCVGLPISLDQAVLVVGGQHLSWLHRPIPQGPEYQQLTKELHRMEPTTKKPIIASTQLPTTPGMVATVNSKNRAKKEASEVQWVQCDKCGKWRVLPGVGHPQYPLTLPDEWQCGMNTWNPAEANCNVPEDTSSASEMPTHRAIKLRVWVRRLRAADKYEAKHGRDIVENNKPFGCVDWIRCSSATCGKWRACLRGMNAKALRKEFPKWYCWMNSWDEAKSSCSAPQEGGFVTSFAELATYEEEPEEEDDETEENGYSDNDNALTLQGISSRGRIVRSRWNSIKRSRR